MLFEDIFQFFFFPQKDRNAFREHFALKSLAEDGFTSKM